ncbi:DUF1934 domain-containing protein [Pseudolactococcus insecticola]|uniref:DUF1934 domain-containing protein n=1 Tax=Pseudolactococcus insecticola TaxID=2709158 RepID=A0A6A0B5I6_9LACT|nr:DUF1934 domain-containing protein [Lactococcus insecticola]GFH39953.1 hypothetical protein Hs20B_03510 [Lactococcus insecticola]
MTQIMIDNIIEIDEQKEVIHEVVTGEYREKNGQQYLIYQNELSEKVVMKYGTEMLTITRFSNPSSIMKMHPEITTKTAIATPVGAQHFDLKTQQYQQQENGFDTQYQLFQMDQKIAQYHLSVRFS